MARKTKRRKPTPLERMCCAQDRYDDACHKADEARRKLNEAQRDYLLDAGWVEETRYDGSNRGYWGSFVRVYRRPKGTRWHTLRGALLEQKKRDRKVEREKTLAYWRTKGCKVCHGVGWLDEAEPCHGCQKVVKKKAKRKKAKK